MGLISYALLKKYKLDEIYPPTRFRKLFLGGFNNGTGGATKAKIKDLCMTGTP